MYEKFNTYTVDRPLLRKIGGWFLVVFGFIALVTPFTPGGLLFFIGLEILGYRLITMTTFRKAFAYAQFWKKPTSKNS